MIIDASAVVAVLLAEAEAPVFAELMTAADRRMSVATWLETAMRIEGTFGRPGGIEVDALIRELGVELVPVTVEQAQAARVAFRRYGKGSGSKAGLTFGDCFAYALAATSGEPLLFKGDDFTHTDVLRAL